MTRARFIFFRMPVLILTGLSFALLDALATLVEAAEAIAYEWRTGAKP